MSLQLVRAKLLPLPVKTTPEETGRKFYLAASGQGQGLKLYTDYAQTSKCCGCCAWASESGRQHPEGQLPEESEE